MAVLHLRKNASHDSIVKAQRIAVEVATETGNAQYIQVGNVVSWGVLPSGSWSWGNSKEDIDAMLAGQLEARR